MPENKDQNNSKYGHLLRSGNQENTTDKSLLLWLIFIFSLNEGKIEKKNWTGKIPFYYVFHVVFLQAFCLKMFQSLVFIFVCICTDATADGANEGQELQNPRPWRRRRRRRRRWGRRWG